MKDYFGLKGKVCVVTGAASGMGKATTEMLVDLGAIVYAMDRSPVDIPGIAKGIRVNLAEKASIDEAFKQIPETFDRFFGVAGVSGLYNGFVETVTINFVANKYITEEYLDKRIPAGGAIVYCTSSGGLGWEVPNCKAEYIELIDKVGWNATVDEVKAIAAGKEHLPAPMYYGLSKRAMNYYVAFILEKFAAKKIRVNAIMPMGTDTGMRDDFATFAGDLESMIEYGTGMAHRLAESREMGDLMVFLNSNMASFLHGVLLSADYGMQLQIEAGIEEGLFGEPLLSHPG